VLSQDLTLYVFVTIVHEYPFSTSTSIHYVAVGIFIFYAEWPSHT